MIRVFPSFEHSAGECAAIRRQFQDFCAALVCTSETKHNRAKPMFELASALFSIADANEFRFARFYIVCEEALLALLVL